MNGWIIHFFLFFSYWIKSRESIYFLDPKDTLEQAQQNKINHIIKKLNLQPGQTFLDIGCGWGGMAFEIARQSQCGVTGISLSENKIK